MLSTGPRTIEVAHVTALGVSMDKDADTDADEQPSAAVVIPDVWLLIMRINGYCLGLVGSLLLQALLACLMECFGHWGL